MYMPTHTLSLCLSLFYSLSLSLTHIDTYQFSEQLDVFVGVVETAFETA